MPKRGTGRMPRQDSATRSPQPPEPPKPQEPRITMLGRPGCHLCDEAREVIAAVAAECGVSWSERDITESNEQLDRYRDMIPVTFVDGVQHDFWRVSADRLRAALGG